MRLIEKYGSYEAAKTELKNMPEKLWANKAALEQELLDYRRDQVFFEVGDICKLSNKNDFYLYRFLRICGNRIYLEDRLGFAEFGINKNAVSHATPEEIQEGHRL